MNMLLFLPFVFLAASLFVQARNTNPARRVAIALVFQCLIGASLVVLGVSTLLPAQNILQWNGTPLALEAYTLRFTPALYLDARGGLMVLMLGLVLPLVWFWLRDTARAASPSFFIAADVLSLGLVGAFLADSLLLFYVFFEISLMGAYFWIGLHGRGEKTNENPGASSPLTRFLLFTLTGSLAMLVSLATIYAAGNDARLSSPGTLVAGLSPTLRMWTGAGFFLAFAIKMPLFIFHGWMRETYRGAPPLARAILSAAMSKLGAYGFLAILLPAYRAELAQVAGVLQVLAVGGIIYGALLCLGVRSFRDVLVYSSLTHLSLIALGFFTGLGDAARDASPIQAAAFQMFNHGLIMAVLFALEARITRSNQAEFDFSGVRAHLPRLSAILLLAIFVSISLPGTGSFAAEVLILFAAYRHSLPACLLALLGLLVAAAALVRVYQRLFLGETRGPQQELARDLSPMEAAVGVLCGILWVATGVFPMYVLGPLEALVLAGR